MNFKNSIEKFVEIFNRSNLSISRFASKDFAKALRDNLVEDMTNTFGSFGKRYLWDKNLDTLSRG